MNLYIIMKRLIEKMVYLTSMQYWYPRIRDLKIPQPKTKIYKLTEQELKTFHNEQFPGTLIENIQPIISEFSYPLFVRTDFASGKHGWEDTCFIESEEKLVRNILEIVVENLIADLFGFPFEALVFREYIPLEAGFKAFYGNMPVAKERRYFINNKQIQCHHPYWPKEAIRTPNKKEWEEILATQNEETEDEIKLLSNYCLMVSEVLDGYWSIDFAYGQDKKWYLIDLAVGEESFHWLDCEFCPEEMRKQYQRINEQDRKKSTNIKRLIEN